jgi:hypothetical protein
MKKLILLLLVIQLFGFEGAMIKGLSKFFSKTTIEIVASKYGNNGLKALEKLVPKYGSRGVEKLEMISAKYGSKGIDIVAKYGEIAIKNRIAFEMVSKYGNRGVYLLRRFPVKATEYYKKFGDKFVDLTEKFGTTRIIKYLDEAKKYGADGKIVKFLEKFGDKANIFLEKHWGKLLISGFVLLNADDIIQSMKNVTKTGIKEGGEVIIKSVDSIVNSQFGLLAGLSLILFIIFKFGIDFFMKFRKK